MYSIEVYLNHKVIDVIDLDVKYFSEILMKNTHRLMHIVLIMYLVCKQAGRTKNDMPYLDSGQSVIETYYARFSLFHRMVDEKTKEKLRAIKNLDDVSKF